MNDSLTVFGDMAKTLGLITEDSVELSPAEQDQALREAEQAVRKTHFNEIQTIRKRGEGFLNAKLAAPGRFLEWQKEMRRLYIETDCERGFIWGEKTIENYINVHMVFLLNDGVYEKYRDFPGWIFYQACSYHLNGRNPESVPAIQQIRAKSIGTIPETTGQTSSVQGCGVPDSYPALIEMCEAGEISQIAALRIVDECDQLSTVVRNAVQLWGVRGPKELQVLCDIEASIERALGNHEPHNNVFVEAATTKGLVSDENGDQIPLRDMSARELWAGYRRSRIPESGGGGGSKTKSLYNDLITHEEALTIARDLQDEGLLAELENVNTERSFKLKLDQPID